MKYNMNTYSEKQATSPLVAFDAQLAERPFGNSAYIIEQLHVRYKRWLGTISAHLPVAGKLLDALCRADTYRQYRVIGDTVVRCAVHYALTTITTVPNMVSRWSSATKFFGQRSGISRRAISAGRSEPG